MTNFKIKIVLIEKSVDIIVGEYFKYNFLFGLHFIKKIRLIQDEDLKITCKQSLIKENKSEDSSI